MGVYKTWSVFSKKRVLFGSTHPPIPPHTMNDVETRRVKLKHRIWKIKTLPKIRLFLWRVASGALAVSDRLGSKGLGVDNTCKLCQKSSETIFHVLFGCSVAEQMLNIANISFPAAGFSDSVEENLSYMLDLIDAHEIADDTRKSIPWIMWSVWKNQNTILYAQK